MPPKIFTADAITTTTKKQLLAQKHIIRQQHKDH